MELFLLELDGLWRDFDQVFLLELVMLCLSMAVGFYVLYTDVRFRDISPLAVWGLLGAGLLGQLGFWWAGQTEPTQIGIVCLTSFGVSYLLYLYGFWAPGDAKLFWALVVAFPPTLCFDTNFFSLHAPLWALLINAVLFNFLFLLLFLLFQRGHRRHSSRPSSFSVKAWLHAGLEVAALSGLVLGGGLLVLERTLIFAEATITVVVLYLLWERFVPQDYRLALSFPGLALGIYAAVAPESWRVALILWLVAWGIQSMYHLIKTHLGDVLVQSIAIDALHEGMVPAVAICACLQKEQGKGPYICVEEVKGVQHVLCRPGMPLGEAEVSKLRDLGRRGFFEGFGNRLAVESSMPFAPFLVLSVAITAVVNGNITIPLNLLAWHWLR